MACSGLGRTEENSRRGNRAQVSPAETPFSDVDRDEDSLTLRCHRGVGGSLFWTSQLPNIDSWS
jgi:hypothetical protein